MMNKQTSVITKDPVFFGYPKEVSTTMVEINISVKTSNNAQLQDLLEHIIREITDRDYRLNEIVKMREVDEDWICLEEGKYHWSRNERV